MDFLGYLAAAVVVWWIYSRIRSPGKPKVAAPPPPPRANVIIRSNLDQPKSRTQRTKKPALIPATLPEEFIVFDLETTGLSEAHDSIIEIGAIKANLSDLQNNKPASTFQTLIRSTDKIPENIVELTGITTKMVVTDGVSLEQAVKDFFAFAGNRPLVAYNAPFDLRFLDAAINQCNLPERTNPAFCALAVARQAWPGRQSYKLNDLANSVDAGQAHRALADCHRALIVFVTAMTASTK